MIISSIITRSVEFLKSMNRHFGIILFEEKLFTLKRRNNFIFIMLQGEELDSFLWLFFHTELSLNICSSKYF
jgi:hypothetical protein